MEDKTNISRDAWNSLMVWPDWPWPLGGMLGQI